MVAQLVDHVFENPATSGGLLVMALTVTAIVSNAMFLQSGHHPGPLFAPQVQRSQHPAKASQVAARAPESARLTTNIPPMPRLAPVPLAAAPAEEAPPPQAQPSTAPPTLISGIQRELARLGLYTGAIDGMNGPRTAAAISSYEVAAGLVPTGIPTEKLLTALKQPSSAPTPDAALTTDSIAAELDSRTQARAEAIATAKREQAELRLQENYRIVQNALNRIGYGPVDVTGKSDRQTQDAIRRFELDNGLDITGEVNDSVIARLIAIGAVKAG